MLFEAIVEPDDLTNGKVRVRFPRTETEKLREGTIVSFDLMYDIARWDCQEHSKPAIEGSRSRACY
jgi:hypothetical protein